MVLVAACLLVLLTRTLLFFVLISIPKASAATSSLVVRS